MSFLVFSQPRHQPELNWSSNHETKNYPAISYICLYSAINTDWHFIIRVNIANRYEWRVHDSEKKEKYSVTNTLN